VVRSSYGEAGIGKSALLSARRCAAGGPSRGSRPGRREGRQRVGHRPFTQPEEVADLVLVLASDRTGNITGADFVIDGGLVTTP
jgi:NAD(P)-dependent dehydrogenase (short-subunit alcohol dehydrogenase family)